jgi:hypothetical protein
MNTTILIALLILPFLAGALFLGFFFRRVNRKYRELFEKLCAVSRQKPLELQQHLARHCEDSEQIVEILGRVLRIHKVEILKAGRSSTQLQLLVDMNRSAGVQQLFVSLSKNQEDEWAINSVTKISSESTNTTISGKSHEQ